MIIFGLSEWTLDAVTSDFIRDTGNTEEKEKAM